jgi:hypothetical protein
VGTEGKEDNDSRRCHCWNLVKDGNGVLDSGPAKLHFVQNFNVQSRA